MGCFRTAKLEVFKLQALTRVMSTKTFSSSHSASKITLIRANLIALNSQADGLAFIPALTLCRKCSGCVECIQATTLEVSRPADDTRIGSLLSLVSAAWREQYSRKDYPLTANEPSCDDGVDTGHPRARYRCTPGNDIQTRLIVPHQKRNDIHLLLADPFLC